MDLHYSLTFTLMLLLTPTILSYLLQDWGLHLLFKMFWTICGGCLFIQPTQNSRFHKIPWVIQHWWRNHCGWCPVAHVTAPASVICWQLWSSHIRDWPLHVRLLSCLKVYSYVLRFYIRHCYLERLSLQAVPHMFPRCLCTHIYFSVMLSCLYTLLTTSIASHTIIRCFR